MKYIVVSIVLGLLFAALDGVVNANPLAQVLYEVYKPLTKASLSLTRGIIIDLAYGFLIAGIYLLLRKSLPGNSGLVKGLSYAVIIWFFRVVMYSATQWVTMNVPDTTVLYTLLAGLGEMLVLGVVSGLTLG